MSSQSKKAIVFDLDGTLTESKQSLDFEMAELLLKLVDKGFFIAVMSGGSLDQFKHQFLESLAFSPEQYERLILVPTSGASMYRYQNKDWSEVYRRDLSAGDQQIIIATLKTIIETLGFLPSKSYGEIIENRGTQITYSALGQQAPIAEKKIWDPDQKKRRQIVELFLKQLPLFEPRIGGMTSVDITQKGVDKAYGVKKLSEILSIPVKEMIYVGDALFPGGNDEPVRASGIDCVSVADFSETKNYIRSLIE